MPGLKKTQIAGRFREALVSRGVRIVDDEFAGPRGILPYRLRLEFPGGWRRRYAAYFWTVHQGGSTRSPEEYRIQLKLREDTRLRFDTGTTVLLGYYEADVDREVLKGRMAIEKGTQVFVAWDPLEHLQVGRSSSCQVPFGMLHEAHIYGLSQGTRRLEDGGTENVLALRPEYLAGYLAETSRGHRHVTPEIIRTSGNGRVGIHG